jgi:DNA-3-methyladenine glycosylase I
MNRCHWVNLNNKNYVTYHDKEWGIASHDDNYLFEMLLLESFQAGLSWECILNKRDAFKKDFDNFNYKKIAKYDEEKINELINNKDIVRNKLKIKASITNAKVFIEIQKEYKSFSNYIWSFTNNKIITNKTSKVIVSSPLSDKISNDLKKRGMKFVGTTIIYSYLQAIGIINDHEPSCDLYYKNKNS